MGCNQNQGQGVLCDESTGTQAEARPGDRSWVMSWGHDCYRASGEGPLLGNLLDTLAAH